MVQEKIIVGSGGEYPLNGMLTIPNNGKIPYPAVVFVHGSGSSDMDSMVYNVRPFKDFAEGLAKLGIASIRYDKRSFAHPRKIAKVLKTFTAKEEAVEDALLAANILRNDPRIDSNKIFIAGHSLGGMLAPRIDAEGGNFTGLILLGGTPRRLEEVMKWQLEDSSLNTSKGFMSWLVTRQLRKMLPKLDNLYNMSDEEAKNIKLFGGLSAIYYKDMGKKRVSEYLKDCTKPILVMHGEADFQVLVDKDFNEYKRILQHNPNAVFKLYPNLNHVFMPSVCGAVKSPKEEYSKPQNVPDYVIADIAEWINKIEG
jgi:pimeloyl-ACP methyl ester carboxylesterase